MTRETANRVWVGGILLVLWGAFVALLLFILGHMAPAMSGGRQLQLDAPRVGVGWDLRVWFLGATVVWAAMLVLAALAGRVLCRRRTASEREDLRGKRGL